jgi:hypothetical protein
MVLVRRCGCRALGRCCALLAARALDAVSRRRVARQPRRSRTSHLARWADCVLVGTAARSGAAVDVRRPGVVVAAAVGERADRISEPVVAGPAEAGVIALAGLDRDGGVAAVGGERGLGGVAVAAVARAASWRGRTLPHG